MSQGIELTSDEVRELSAGVVRLTAALDRFSNSALPGSSSIRIDAGGVGVWAATLACISTLLVVFICAVWVGREFDRIGLDADRKDRDLSKLSQKLESQQDYLNVIYQSLPALQKPEKK